MAGLYVHIPFCKSRCAYCNFFSTTSLDFIDRYVEALAKEIRLRKDYLPQNSLATLYFGGGTPSLLQSSHLKRIMDVITSCFTFEQNPEITIEANPDDMKDNVIRQWGHLGFNRLSIGIQSFNDTLLRLVNRRHDASMAIEAVRLAQKSGFHNISIDLMYGLPGQTIDDWKADIHQALLLGVQHISAYGLSYEEGTPLYKRCQNNEIVPSDDELYNEMYDILCMELRQAGFERYEVSNFALPGYYSRHNSSYWYDIPYMGIGPAAHSYNGDSRQWNVEDLNAYLQAISAGEIPCEQEYIDSMTRYNEYVMLALRTSEGIDLSVMEQRFGLLIADYCRKQAQPYLSRNQLLMRGTKLVPTQQGIKLLNLMIEDLMQDI